MEYLQRGLMSHGLDPGGVKPLDASVPRASGEVAGLGPSRNPSSSTDVRSRRLLALELGRQTERRNDNTKRRRTLSKKIMIEFLGHT